MPVEEHLERRYEREEVLVRHHVARDAQAIERASALVVEGADRVPVARSRLGRAEPRGLGQRGAVERAQQLAIRVVAPLCLVEMSRVVPRGAQVAREHRDGVLAPGRHRREPVDAGDAGEGPPERLPEARPERAVPHLDHVLRRRPVEAVVEKHLEIFRRSPPVLVLRRERVAREQEDLLRVVEQPVAACLAGRLLHRLETERVWPGPEEPPRELARIDDDVAPHGGPTGVEDPRPPRVAARSGPRGGTRRQVHEVELLRREERPERLDLLRAVERDRADRAPRPRHAGRPSRRRPQDRRAQDSCADHRARPAADHAPRLQPSCQRPAAAHAIGACRRFDSVPKPRQRGSRRYGNRARVAASEQRADWRDGCFAPAT